MIISLHLFCHVNDFTGKLNGFPLYQTDVSVTAAMGFKFKSASSRVVSSSRDDRSICIQQK